MAIANITNNILTDSGVATSSLLTTDTSQAITANKSFTVGFSLASEGLGNQTSFFRNTSSIFSGSGGSNIFGFNNSNNIYFGKGLNNGGVLQWNNTTATRYYTLPDADGTLALTSQIPANPVGGTGTSGQIAYFSGTSAITSESGLTWDATNNNLSIGGVTANSNLTVSGSDNTNIFTVLSGLNSRLHIGTVTSPNNDVYIRSQNNYNLKLGTNNTNYLTIFNSGNVFIGTSETDNGAKLQVNGTSTFSSTVRPNSNYAADLGTSSFRWADIFGFSLNVASSVTADSLLVQRTASRNMLGISSIALPTSGAEEGVAVVKTNSNLWQMSLVGYAVDSKGMRVYNTGGVGYTSFEVAQGAGTRFIVDGVGNVGIGTTSPNRLTEIVSSSGGVLGVSTSANGSSILYGRIAMYSTAGSNSYIDYGGEIRSYSGAGIDYSDLRFYTAGGSVSAERMRITSSGNVGIGTTSPDIFGFGTAGKYLTVQSNAGGFSLIQVISDGTSGSGINFGNATIRRASIDALNGSHLEFYTNGTNSGTSVSPRMRITSGGNVLIGGTSSTNSTALLQVFGSTQVSTNNGQIRINDSVTTSKTLSIGVDGANNVAFLQSFQDGVAYRNLILNGLGGNVLIGTTTDNGNRLQVNGDSTFGGKAFAGGFTSRTGTVSIASGATATITNMDVNGVFLVNIQVNGGSLIFNATNYFMANNTNGQYVNAGALYDGANVTLSNSGSAIQITNNGFSTLLWHWSVFIMPYAAI